MKKSAEIIEIYTEQKPGQFIFFCEDIDDGLDEETKAILDRLEKDKK